MKKQVIQSFLVLLIGLCFSCGSKSSYKKAKAINTVEAFEKFERKHRKSKYIPEVQSRLVLLRDQEDWAKAAYHNYLEGYKKYIALHPNGRYVFQARNRINQIEKEIADATAHEKAWDAAKRANTVESFEYFVQNYPYSIHRTQALNYAATIKENQFWS